MFRNLTVSIGAGCLYATFNEWIPVSRNIGRILDVDICGAWTPPDEEHFKWHIIGRLITLHVSTRVFKIRWFLPNYPCKILICTHSIGLNFHSFAILWRDGDSAKIDKIYISWMFHCRGNCNGLQLEEVISINRIPRCSVCKEAVRNALNEKDILLKIIRKIARHSHTQTCWV